MKNLTFALLLFTAAPAIAQQNELVLSPAYVRYNAHGTFLRKNAGKTWDINAGGYQLGLTYLRNINWLQIGGSVDVGKLNSVEDEVYQPVGRHTAADPYIIFSALLNGRFVVRKWNLYGGPSAGYLIASSRDAYNWGPSPDIWIKGEKYSMTGRLIGGQIGASYQLHPKLSLSADFAARFARVQRSSPDSNGNVNVTLYDRLNMYNFGLGVRYRF